MEDWVAKMEELACKMEDTFAERHSESHPTFDFEIN